MNLKIRWSEPALLILAEVLEYTVLMHGKRQAKKIRSQVMDAVRLIAKSPYIAAIEPYSEKFCGTVAPQLCDSSCAKDQRDSRMVDIFLLR